MLTQAVFLVGGMGTRLKERTSATPKPLLEVGGRPFLDYLLDEAARHGFSDILLLAGHFGDQIQTRYHGRNWRGARIRVLREPEPLGTGGALRFALPHLARHFLLSNGDSFFDINLRAVTQGGEAGGITMALRAGVDDSRYGRVRLENGLVRSFHAPEEGQSGPINAGIYAIERALLEAMPGGKVSLEGDLFPAFARQGNIRGLVFDRYFIDIGVPSDFDRAQTEMPAGMRRPAIFFDRDGVLNVEKNYLHRSADLEWMPGARAAVRLANDAGYYVFVVTNQAGVARGYYGEEDVRALHAFMAAELAAEGAHVDAFEYCPHHPEGTVAGYAKACGRRKPEAGMIRDLADTWPVDMTQSLLIGDKPSDLEAAKLAGILGFQYADGDLVAFLRRVGVTDRS